MVPILFLNGNAQRTCRKAQHRVKERRDIMNTRTSNVIVYVQQPVHQGQARVVSKAFGALRGLVSAAHSRRLENVICVDYDPRTIGSLHILQCARDQGVSARLVGM
jgi:hypothetical protein